MGTLYPPILAASQPAFVSASLYTINFTVPNLVSISDIGHLQIKITQQSNGASIVNTQKYPDGIIYKLSSEVNFVNGTVTINTQDLKDGWVTDTYYKVQMRFGADSKEIQKWLGQENLQSFYSWKTTQINSNTTTYQSFGEWSTIMVIKCISKPTITITSEQTSESGNIQFDSTVRAIDTITPLFSGYYATQSNEPVDRYKFQVFKGQSTDESNLVLDSGWLQHDSTKDNLLLDSNWLKENQIEESQNNPWRIASVDEHRFKEALEEDERYTLVYSVITKNGYEGSSKADYFEVILSRLNKIPDMSLNVYDHTNSIANEEGCMVLEINFDVNTTGNFIIIRTDEYSNYNYWEDLCYFVVSNSKETLYKTDYTIESGIKYKYAIVKENGFGYRTIPLMEKKSPERWVNFQYNYLLGTKGHIRLQYDNKIQSFKKNVLQNKQDTLGGIYPTITKNGYAYYSEFQVEGLITIEQELSEYVDSNSFKFKTGDYLIGADKICFSAYSKDNYWQRAPELNDELGKVYVYAINNLDNCNNLTDDYYFIERKYRELLIDFLNDGEYKLYKSPTEGNILIALTNVSLTPSEELGRLIYSFSATATEIDEVTLENLDEFGLIDIGEFQEQIGDIETVVGQVSGLFTETDDIMQAIVEDCHVQLNGREYEHRFRNLKAISIDSYPSQDFDAEISILDVQLSELQNKIEIQEDLTEYEYLKMQKQIKELEQQKTELEKLKNSLSTTYYYPSIKLSIDGNEIRVKPNKTYNLDNFNMTSGHQIYCLPHEATDKESKEKVKFYTPIIVNYIARVITVEALARTVVKKDVLTVWGQLAGAFETNKTILNNYNNLRIKTNYRIYNETDPENGLYNIKNQRGYIVIQTTDILSAIKQLCLQQAENAYGTTFDNYDEENDIYDDGTRYYAFEYISKIDIEADEGTIIYIQGNDSAERAIRIGATERYVINNLKTDDITGIRFAENSKNYALINYSCKTTVTTMGASKG